MPHAHNPTCTTAAILTATNNCRGNIFLDKRLGRLIQLVPDLEGVTRRGQNQRKVHNPGRDAVEGVKGGT